ncbi:MAG: DegT/DnrJ/EryC1/StrS family aminotransferase [Bacteroidales bacterium]|nr:MAG: DegT/DnrJ/EryC1/StrS family aminotransferase [Bacteroidales bacterium]
MINVTKTYLPALDKYQDYVRRIFESGWLTNNGEFTRTLEERLSEYLQVPYIVLVSNGTLALQIAYRLLDLKNEAITTPFSFVATSSSMAWEGIQPVFADIDPESFNIDPKKVKERITPSTSAIVAVHVFGNPCDDESLSRISKEHSIPIVYDAAHAFGVKYNGQSVAELGNISIFSFHATKIFHTIEGGAIIVKDKATYDKAKLLINFGIPGYDQISELGINAKMNEFQAAMGLCILDEIENIIEGRKIVSDRYTDSLSHINSLTFQHFNSSATNNYAYFPLVLPTEDILLKVKGELNRTEIFPRRYFYPSLEKLNYVKPQKTPIADSISRRVLCLPLFGDLDWGAQKRIIDTIKTSI